MRNLTATICVTLVVLLGSAGMSWSADFQKGVAAYNSGDYATALREWTPLAEQGDAIAQYNLGVSYDNGEGVPQDDKTTDSKPSNKSTYLVKKRFSIRFRIPI